MAPPAAVARCRGRAHRCSGVDGVVRFDDDCCCGDDAADGQAFARPLQCRFGGAGMVRFGSAPRGCATAKPLHCRFGGGGVGRVDSVALAAAASLFVCAVACAVARPAGRKCASNALYTTLTTDGTSGEMSTTTAERRRARPNATYVWP